MSTAETAQLAWFKSSYSGNEGGACLEVALTPVTIHVRDSKDIARPGVAVSAGAWGTFIGMASMGSAS